MINVLERSIHSFGSTLYAGLGAYTPRSICIMYFLQIAFSIISLNQL
uniref:Uncharacterized protein n=1 Tax=Arundo donax TaxID=35708 RepID=A0A0A9E8F1_ARUDO